MSLLELIKIPLKQHWFMGVTMASSVVAFSAHHFAHTEFIDKHKNIFCMHENTKPIEIHPQINLLFKKVLQDLNIPKEEQTTYEPFMFIGLDTYVIGSAQYKSGVKIGIPLTYAYSKMAEMNSGKIFISNEPVDWSRPTAQVFLNTLILSEEAKKFSIAHEIISSQNYDLMRKTYSYPALIIGTSYIYLSIYKKFKLALNKPFIRVLIYSCCALACGTLWWYQDNYFTYRREKKVNEILATKGPQYIKGGFEFYDKILQRNMAIRPLMPDNGKNAFTDRGEQISKWYIFKNMLISERRNFFALKLKEHVSENITSLDSNLDSTANNLM